MKLLIDEELAEDIETFFWKHAEESEAVAMACAIEDLPPAAQPIPTVEELAVAMYQDNTALLTNVQARYIAKVVHALLTKGRGGV